MIDTSKMSRAQVERLSKRSAKKIIQGTDKLKSWGKSGSLRLNKYFQFRSSIELNVIRQLDLAEDFIEDFDTECFLIEYKYKGATLNYVPDVILKTVNGNVYVIEVKPASQLREDKNIAKWDRAKTWCWNRNARFFVITEKDCDNIIDIIKNFDDGKQDKARELLEWNQI